MRVMRGPVYVQLGEDLGSVGVTGLGRRCTERTFVTAQTFLALGWDTHFP